jgi:hypothetical protein
MKRVMLLAAVSLLVCGVVIACGQSESSDPEPTRTPAEPAPTVEPPEPPADPEPPPEPAGAEREDQSELDCEDESADCPMFAWMDQNTVPAVEGRDTKALAIALHQIEFMAPDPSWNEPPNGWAQIARRGAIAAEAGDFEGARAACKSCHTEYPTEDESFRDKYRKEGFRTDGLPEMPENAAEGMPDLEMGE